LICCSFVAANVGFELFVLDSARVVGVDHLEEGVDVLALDGDLELGNKVGHLVDGQMAGVVEVKVVENLAQEGGVVTAKLEGTGAHLSKKVVNGLSNGLGVFVLGNLPGGLHHLDKVLVARGAHGNVGVVVAELVDSNNAVVVASCAVELVEEVFEDLFLGLAALEELGVAANVIDATDVGDSDFA